jgi:hypothetical protein
VVNRDVGPGVEVRRVRIVERAGGAVARSEWFEDPDDARRRWEEVAGDAAEQDAAAFRARYRLS